MTALYEKPIKSLDQQLNIMWQVANRFGSNRFPSEDLVQEMWLKPQVREAEYVSHLRHAAKCAIYDYFRAQLGRNREKQPQYVGLELLLEEQIGEIEDKIKDIDAKLDFETATRRLSRTQKLILKLRADFTYREMGKIIGVSHARIYKLLQPFQK